MKKIILFALLAVPLVVFGQTSNSLILTWQANNYFPADYRGKAEASPGALIVVSAEAVKNGKIVDATNADVKWYVDESKIADGQGIKTVSFNAAKNSDGYQIVRADVTAGNDNFENSIRIPVTSTKVVLSVPAPTPNVKPGDQVSIQAIPFFFNVDSLSGLNFSWVINGAVAAGQNGSQISLKVGSPQSDFQNSIQAEATVQNTGNPFELNKGSLILNIIQ